MGHPSDITRPAVRRRTAAAITAVICMLAGLLALFVLPASAEPTVDGPDRVYTPINTPLPFLLADPISLQERTITIEAVEDDTDPCVVDDGANSRTGSCVFIQLQVLRGTLEIDTTGVTLESGTTGSAGPINLGGTEDAINAALLTLVYTPDNDYVTTDSLPERLRINVLDTDSESSGNVDIDIFVKDENVGPTLTVPADSSVAAGDTIVWDDGMPDPDDRVEVEDPDVSQGDLDDLLLMVIWVDEGDFSFRNAPACVQPLASILTCPNLPTLPPPLDDLAMLLPGLLDGVPPDAAFGGGPTGINNYAQAWGLVAGLDNLNDILSRIEYRAPNNDCDCRFYAVVTDLGNNGMPLPGEIPDIGLDVDWWDVTVRDDVNDPPVLTLPVGPFTVEVNESVALPTSVDDPDADPENLLLSVSATGGTTNLDGDTVGTLAELNALLATLTFTAGPTDGTGTVTMVVNDQGNTGSGGPQTANAVLEIEITDSSAPTTTAPTTTAPTTTAPTTTAPTTTAPTTTAPTTTAPTTTAPTTTAPTTTAPTTTAPTTTAPTTTAPTTTAPTTTAPTTTAPTTTTPTTTAPSTTAPSTTAPSTTAPPTTEPGETTTTTEPDVDATTSTTNAGGTSSSTSTPGGDATPTSQGSDITAPAAVAGAGQQTGVQPTGVQATSRPLPVTGTSLDLFALGTVLVALGLGLQSWTARRRNDDPDGDA